MRQQKSSHPRNLAQNQKHSTFTSWSRADTALSTGCTWKLGRTPNSEKLDDFLRGIWLECCGHLSAFTIEGERYVSEVIKHPLFDFDPEKGMGIKIGNVVKPEMKFTHEYDFGTTTELKLKVISERMGQPRSEPVQLMAKKYPAANHLQCLQKTRDPSMHPMHLGRRRLAMRRMRTQTQVRRGNAPARGQLPTSRNVRIHRCSRIGNINHTCKGNLLHSDTTQKRSQQGCS